MTKTTASAKSAATSKSAAKPAAKTSGQSPGQSPAKAPAKAATGQAAGKVSAGVPSSPKGSVRSTVSAQAPAPNAEAVMKARSGAPAHPLPKKISSTSDNMPSATTKVDSKLASAWKNKAGRDLTEAELQAMPETEYMNDKQLEFFRARLEAQKEDLLSNAGETTEHLREDTSIVPDPADRATIEEEHALELRTRDRERELLKKISQALVRIDSGEYGFCDETGEPIGLGRLLARPTATLSLEAQQRRELKQKMFGD